MAHTQWPDEESFVFSGAVYFLLLKTRSLEALCMRPKGKKNIPVIMAIKLIGLYIGLQLLMIPAFSFSKVWAGSWRTVSAGGMSVELYVPATAPKLADKRALMVSLHGCVQTNRVLRDQGNWSVTADEYGMVVAVPAVPDGGKIVGCWDYFGRAAPFFPPPPPHSRNSRDNDNLLALVQTLQSDVSLNIDPAQIYITGLSSGGGQTLVMGCLAPEIFAGIGINAGPTIGTGSHEINPPDITSLPITPGQAKAVCQELAGSHSPAFATQLTSVIYGSEDQTVDPRYNQLNTEIMASIYEVSDISNFSVNEFSGHNPRGAGKLWSDNTGPRISMIRSDGLGHAWPAGSGPGGEINFVAREGINYPAYVTQFFFENNRRVLKNPPPLISASAQVEGLQVKINGKAEDDGNIADLRIVVTGLIKEFSEGPTSIVLSDEGNFEFTSGPLPDNNAYRAVVTAIDDLGASSEAVLLFDIGQPPHPPVIEQVSVTVNGNCLAVFGTASDADGDLARVEVAIANGEPRPAILNDEAWALVDVCGLDTGNYMLVVKAVDMLGHESEPVTERFTISPPYQVLTNTLTGHVSALRIRFYPGLGFGTADVSYIELLRQHGIFQIFPLYGFENQWYADPSNLLGNTLEDIRIRALLMGNLSDTIKEKQITTATAKRRFNLPSTQTEQIMEGKMERLTIDQLLRILSKQGATISLEMDATE
jgi:poly(hydroxyalkanoate) depolymerase family esterase